MTWFRDIQAVDEVGDISPDEAGRALFVFNILATTRGSDTFVEELLAILEAAGLGTRGTTLLGSAMAEVPKATPPGAEDEPFIHVRATGGPTALGTHNLGPLAYRRRGARVLVHAKTAAAANQAAQRALAALLAIRSREVQP